jgi:transcriptional regulator with XRE-family HTH domain
MNIANIRSSRFMVQFRKFANQASFAKAAGLSTAHVSLIVNGKRGIGEAIARRIERNLKLPERYIDGEGVEDPPKIEPQYENVMGGSSSNSRHRREEWDEMEDANLQYLREKLEAQGVNPERVLQNSGEITPLGMLKFGFVIPGDRPIGLEFIKLNYFVRQMFDKIAGLYLRNRSIGGRYRIYIAIDGEPRPADRIEDLLGQLVKDEIVSGWALTYLTDAGDPRSYDAMIGRMNL